MLQQGGTEKMPSGTQLVYSSAADDGGASAARSPTAAESGVTPSEDCSHTHYQPQQALLDKRGAGADGRIMQDDRVDNAADDVFVAVEDDGTPPRKESANAFVIAAFVLAFIVPPIGCLSFCLNLSTRKLGRLGWETKMFCSCCRDVQPGCSTSELRLGDDKGHEPCTDRSGAGQDSTSTSNAGAHLKDGAENDTVAKIGPESPHVNSAEAPSARSQDEQRAPIKGGVFKPPPKPEPAPVVVPLTLNPGDKARRTSAPIAGTLAAGAYLMYDKESDSLYCQWSTAPQAAALAWLMPVVQVPGHKYNVNKGKQLLAKDCKNYEKYLQGWVTFVKITREYPSKLMLLENFESSGAPDARIFLLEVPPDKAGTSFCREITEFNKLYDLIKNIKAVAAVPVSSTLLNPDEEMDTKTFVQRGSGIGAAGSLTG